MQDDPYMRMAEMMARPDPADGLILAEGTVQSVSPLRVSAFGNLFSGVKVNAQLMSGWSQDVKIEQASGTISGKETVTGGMLAPGDTVLILTNGGETLYILAKVVGG